MAMDPRTSAPAWRRPQDPAARRWFLPEEVSVKKLNGQTATCKSEATLRGHTSGHCAVLAPSDLLAAPPQEARPLDHRQHLDSGPRGSPSPPPQGTAPLKCVPWVSLSSRSLSSLQIGSSGFDQRVEMWEQRIVI